MMTAHSDVNPCNTLNLVIQRLALASSTTDQEFNIMQEALAVALKHVGDRTSVLSEIAGVVKNTIADEDYEDSNGDLDALYAYCELPSEAKAAMPSFYSLIYMERDTDADARVATVGPKIFATETEALASIMSYVCPRVAGCFGDELSEAIEEQLLEIEELAGESWYTSITVEELSTVLLSLNEQQSRALVDWYFGMQDADECTEAYYTIQHHTLTTFPA